MFFLILLYTRSDWKDILVSGALFPIQPSELLTPTSPGSDSCVLEVQPIMDGMPFILGDTFLRTVAAIFDTSGPRIGLARRLGAEDLEPPARPFGPPVPDADWHLQVWLPVAMVAVAVCLSLRRLPARMLRGWGWSCSVTGNSEESSAPYLRI